MHSRSTRINARARHPRDQRRQPAIAAAFAARAVGTSAKVVMKEGANPFRVAECRRFGGDIVFEADFHAAFRRVEEIACRKAAP